MTLSSLPSRPLKEAELRSLDSSIEFTAPMVVFPLPEGCDIHAAVLVQEDHVTAIVLDPGDGWRVLDRRDRPTPPRVLEAELRDWAAAYPFLVPIC